MKSILIVDDEKHTRDGLSAVLADDYDVFAASGADEAIKMLDAEDFDGVITDFRMAGKSGMSVIDKAFSMPKKPVCIMLTAYGNVEIAVEAMKRGAGDFLPKPVDIARLEKILKDLLKKRDAMLEAKRAEARAEVEKQKSHHYSPQVAISGANITLSEIVAKSSQMKSVIERALQVAHSKATVMLTGETGTGKELFAQALHTSGNRSKKRFVSYNCAAIPATLLEGILFGTVKGGFTGAENRQGLFEIANGGTLFLDEVGNLPIETQQMLLRAIQEKRYRPIGAKADRTFNARIIAATNENLNRSVTEKRFRQDLLYRLQDFTITVPPLRECQDDIMPLAEFFRKQANKEFNRQTQGFDNSARTAILFNKWSGNVRELRQKVRAAVLLAEHELICREDLELGNTREYYYPLSLKTNKKEEKKRIIQAIEYARGNYRVAAYLLEVSVPTLYHKVKQHNIKRRDKG